MRKEREYTVEYRDETGAQESEVIMIAAGTEEEQDSAAWKQAESMAEAWCLAGEWGEDGASVEVYYSLDHGEYDFPERQVVVEVAPNHDALISAAGGDTDCEHDWTSEGEGGCSENPGVWSTGGTEIWYARHCRKCGLSRRECSRGSNRNNGEHDTVRYEQPDAWCAECEREECACD